MKFFCVALVVALFAVSAFADTEGQTNLCNGELADGNAFLID